MSKRAVADVKTRQESDKPGDAPMTSMGPACHKIVPVKNGQGLAANRRCSLPVAHVDGQGRAWCKRHRPQTHSMLIAERCVEQARAQVGAGWDHISSTLRRGLVMSEVVGVVQHATRSYQSRMVRGLPTDLVDLGDLLGRLAVGAELRDLVHGLAANRRCSLPVAHVQGQAESISADWVLAYMNELVLLCDELLGVNLPA